jgi:hypothetical protein
MMKNDEKKIEKKSKKYRKINPEHLRVHTQSLGLWVYLKKDIYKKKLKTNPAGGGISFCYLFYKNRQKKRRPSFCKNR